MIFDMPSCGGCRTCEIACSFHHTNEFQPSVSSIKILNSEKKQGYAVSLADEGDGMTMACDGCRGLDVPLCIQYCKDSDDLGKILKEFSEKRAWKKNEKIKHAL